MTDRKEVIQGLQGVNTYLESKAIEASIEKNDIVREYLIESQTIIDDAIALLKEQVPVKPISRFNKLLNETIYWCGKCETHIEKNQSYCGSCGKAVKWDEI